jgi:hypothetical protein
MAPGNEPGTTRIADGGWREWLCLDDDGLTVRNFLQTCRIGWHEVRRFEDGSESGRRGRHWWALRIVLHDGRVIIADGTSSLKAAARPETLSAIRQAAERHAVPAELTGMPPATGPGVITIADSSWWAWLRFDNDGIMVRNLFRTYRIGWEEVRWFTDGASALPGGGVYYWALDIVLRDGRVITATGTSSQTWTARPGTLTAIRQAAERHGVPAVFTGKESALDAPMPAGLYHDPGGKPGLRDWTGTAWSPYLHVDPASGEPAGEDGTAKVWSPLPEPDQQRHRDHIASRARRAGIWLAVCLVLTAVAMAVGLALYVHDPGKAIAWACGVAACGLVFIGWAWTERRSLKKIDQAGKAAAQLADTRDSTASPLDRRGEADA